MPIEIDYLLARFRPEAEAIPSRNRALARERAPLDPCRHAPRHLARALSHEAFYPFAISPLDILDLRANTRYQLIRVMLRVRSSYLGSVYFACTKGFVRDRVE